MKINPGKKRWRFSARIVATSFWRRPRIVNKTITLNG